MAAWILAFIEQHGYLGIAVLMCVENVFPPIPSELIMPFAGYAAARGTLHPVGVVAAGTAGTVLGALPWYWIGRRIGARRLEGWAARHGRWLTLSCNDVVRAERWFERHGAWSVALGRLVPALRSLISAPAGIMGMPLGSFLLWTVLGSTVWSGALTALGYALEDQHARVAHWLDPVATGVVVLALAGYVWRVATFGRR